MASPTPAAIADHDKQSAKDQSQSTSASTSASSHKNDLRYNNHPKYQKDLSCENKFVEDHPSQAGADLPHNEKFKSWFKRTFLKGLDNPKSHRYRCVSLSWDELRAQATTKPPQGLENISLVSINHSIKIVDRNGAPLAFYIHNGLNLPFHKPHVKDNKGDFSTEGEKVEEEVLKALIDYFREYSPLPTSKDKRHTHMDKADAKKTGTGVHHIGMWQATGHESHDSYEKGDPILRGATLTRQTYADEREEKRLDTRDCVIRLYQRLKPLFQAVGTVFEQIDKDNYERYLKRYNECSKVSGLSSLHTSNRCCFLMAAIIAGRSVELHRDTRDVPDGWICDMAFGDYSGGLLQLPQLGVEINLRPGGLLFMRSELIWHSVSSIQTGPQVEPISTAKRYAIILFTHRGMIESDEQWRQNEPVRKQRRAEKEASEARKLAKPGKLDKKIATVEKQVLNSEDKITKLNREMDTESKNKAKLLAKLESLRVQKAAGRRIDAPQSPGHRVIMDDEDEYDKDGFIVPLAETLREATLDEEGEEPDSEDEDVGHRTKKRRI